jgi:streptogramin lyase
VNRTSKQKADVVREYQLPNVTKVAGVTFDGESVWIATGDRLQAIDPASGRAGRAIDVAADAGTAFDGQHLFQLARGIIHKIDPETGVILATLPSPAGETSSGLTWAEGSLWVANYRGRTIHQLDADSGKVLRTIESTKHVTGVTFVDGELWHGTWEGDESELRRVSLDSGEVLESLEMPQGMNVSGLEHDGAELFYCGGGGSATLRAVRRPKR